MPGLKPGATQAGTRGGMAAPTDNVGVNSKPPLQAKRAKMPPVKGGATRSGDSEKQVPHRRLRTAQPGSG